ncbi:MAG: hypothetical protein Q8Q80_06890 [Methyloversatilis sp.]|uniref:terminase small subunit-like protein n=1 Tax=Methyloversatilis sp. TaxID=2569862 RepID=UPI002734D8F0|nr:hypothetical protein [Methyloversatilis sp.]MDP3872372.1 hypothetical protein [Methyloversatilis sp.]
MGRPVTYDKSKIWPEITRRIANGESLASALRHPGMPSYELARNQIREFPEIKAAYEAAVEDRGAMLAEELIDLADTPIPEDLDPASRSAWVQHLRVRLDTRKWIASRVYRKVYGDKVEVSVSAPVDLVAAMEEGRRRVEANRARTIDMGDVERA